MGSVVVSDVVTNLAAYPHSMVVGDHQRATSGTPAPAQPTQAQSRRAHSRHSSASGWSVHSNSSNPAFSQYSRPTIASQSQLASGTSSSGLQEPTAQAQADGAADRPPAQSRLQDASQGQMQGQTMVIEGVDPYAGQSQPPSQPPSATRQQRPADSSQSRLSNATPSHQHANSIHSNNPTTQASVPPSATATQFPQNSAPFTHFVQSNPPTSPPSPQLLPTIRSTLSMSGGNSPTRIKIRDLNHIQSFASEELLNRSHRSPQRQNTGNGQPTGGAGGDGGGPVGDGNAGGISTWQPQQQYEISAMPVTDIIEMVAGLLTKITSTNDKQHERDVHRTLESAAAVAAAGLASPPPSQPPNHGPANSQSPSHQQSSSRPGSARPQSQQSNSQLSQAYIDRSMHRQTQSVLSFHGKNVPSISILMYLSRIHKYCPTTYEVFLSLLVYFDRMTENINRGIVHSFRGLDADGGDLPASSHGRTTSLGGGTGTSGSTIHPGQGFGPLTPPTSTPASQNVSQSRGDAQTGEDGATPQPQGGIPAGPLGRHFFVVDSFNIHRLVMAGVTCASKFFSDVFYTNSRYAKVGGLPLHELNHLELQFLLLNDFRLYVPVEELEAYGSMLVEFYAKEVMAQQMKEMTDKEERERAEREADEEGRNGSGTDGTAEEEVYMADASPPREARAA